MKPVIEIVIKQGGHDPEYTNTPTQNTIGIKWTMDGKEWHGFWQYSWSLPRLAFVWWILLLGQKKNIVGYVARLVVEPTEWTGMKSSNR